MYRFLSLTLIVITTGLLGTAQQPVGSPTPTPTAEDVVKISTNLIQIDVTVTDKNGKVVPNLKPEDFEIYENGNKQEISNFSFISNVRATDQKLKSSSTEQSVLPPAPLKAESVHRTIALVIDDLSLSVDSTSYLRRALKIFVDEQMQEGDLVAIVRTGTGIGALQQFTTDKRQLYAAIERIKWTPVGTGNMGAFAAMEARSPTEQREDGESKKAGVRTAAGRRKEMESFREAVFAVGTLGAIDYVIRGMHDLPGRKSVMLFSQGFRLYQEDALGFKESSRVLKTLRQLVDQANRASVVIYAMDVRGSAYTGLTAADDVGDRSQQQVEKELRERREKFVDTQAGLQYLAKQTGGFAVVRTNDLAGGIRRILDDQSYYLIAYVPDGDTFDPRTRRFNSIEVKLKQPGMKPRYRSGFFAVPDEKIASDPSTNNSLLNALTSPFAVNQITMRLNALFNSTPVAGPYVHSFLHVKAEDMSFEDQPDGSRKLVFDILAVAFGDNGTIADQISKTYSIGIKKEAYDSFVREGFVYNFTLPIKKPGAYQLRVAIRDHKSQKVGSANQFIEVPDLKSDRLVLSGVMLENIAPDEWKLRQEGKTAGGTSDPLTDTSLRQFKRGTVLNYTFTIFNVKERPQPGSSLQTQIRLFRDGKVIYEGQPQSVPPRSAKVPESAVAGSLVLGDVMEPGEYVLQVNAIDDSGKEQSTASQLVPFEIIE